MRTELRETDRSDYFNQLTFVATSHGEAGQRFLGKLKLFRERIPGIDTLDPEFVARMVFQAILPGPKNSPTHVQLGEAISKLSSNPTSAKQSLESETKVLDNQFWRPVVEIHGEVGRQFHDILREIGMVTSGVVRQPIWRIEMALEIVKKLNESSSLAHVADEFLRTMRGILKNEAVGLED